MTNKNIATFDNSTNLPADPSMLANIGTAVAMSANAGGGDAFLRLLKDGCWVFGADNVEPEEGVRFAVNPYSFQHGFIAWHDSKVEGEVMVPVTQPLPARHELADTPEGWSDQLSVQLRCLSGEDEGIQVLFKTTSVGGKRAIATLATAVGSKAGSGADDVVPVVELGSEHYQHKKYGKIYTPVLNIVGWMAIGDDDAPEIDDEEDEEVIEVPRASKKKRRSRSR